MKGSEYDCPVCDKNMFFNSSVNYYDCWNFMGGCGYRPEGPPGTVPETKAEYASRLKREQYEIERIKKLAKIEYEKQERERKINRKRVIEDPEFRLSYWLQEIRKKYGNTLYEATKDVYVLELKKEAKSNLSALALRKFPSSKYPEINDEPKGFVYVGVADDVKHRFLVHNGTITSGKSKPAKIARRGFLKNPTSFESCGEELTEKYGIRQIGWQQSKQYEKVESWLGYALYKSGYWVWGPHRHEKEDFLGIGDFI